MSAINGHLNTEDMTAEQIKAAKDFIRTQLRDRATSQDHMAVLRKLASAVIIRENMPKYVQQLAEIESNFRSLDSSAITRDAYVELSQSAMNVLGNQEKSCEKASRSHLAGNDLITMDSFLEKYSSLVKQAQDGMANIDRDNGFKTGHSEGFAVGQSNVFGQIETVSKSISASCGQLLSAEATLDEANTLSRILDSASEYIEKNLNKPTCSQLAGKASVDFGDYIPENFAAEVNREALSEISKLRNAVFQAVLPTFIQCVKANLEKEKGQLPS